jgi:beta-glucosidase/6-phospho-beta-glucosidase/beta-galactosidase
VSNGVSPFITLHQWDLPQPLVDAGSWLNESIIDNFGDFARIAFREFGDRVPFWVTLHEPLISCQAEATFGRHNSIEEPPETPYKCVHNVLKAHTTAYRIYKELGLQGQVGLTLNSEWAEPKNASDPEQLKASERLLAFRLGWFLDPIFKQDYPKIMRDQVDKKSQNEGRNDSRLPTFDAYWKAKLNGNSRKEEP